MDAGGLWAAVQRSLQRGVNKALYLMRISNTLRTFSAVRRFKLSHF